MTQKGQLVLAVGLLMITSTSALSADDSTKNVAAALSFKMASLAGKNVNLSQYLGQTVLVVNVASKCGLTPQYAGLQKLHEQYAKEGLAILGFPCNQFGGQEPGSANDIREFCTTNYGVQFDMFSKIEVNGNNACDFYKYLKAQKTAPKGPGDVDWNFEKFLINRNGEVVARFAPSEEPSALVDAIRQQLAK